MKKRLFVSALAGLLLCGSSRGAVVINEIYAGGGSASATAAYKTDFVELFNTDPVNSVDISGYVLAYGSSASATGTFATAIGAVPASTNLGPLAFYLVQTGSSGTGGANDVTPDVDFNSGASLSNTSGGMRLQDAAATTLDIVGWGTTNNFETTPESTPASVAVSMMRIPNGTDTANNQSDFGQTTPTPKAVNPAEVPEPSTLTLLAVAPVLLAGRRRRQG